MGTFDLFWWIIGSNYGTIMTGDYVILWWCDGVVAKAKKIVQYGSGSDKYFSQNLSLGKWHVKVTCPAG